MTNFQSSVNKSELMASYSKHPPYNFSSLENEVERSFEKLLTYIKNKKIITSSLSTFINKALVFSIITNEISREKKKGDTPQSAAMRSIKSFKKFLATNGNIMPIGSRDQYLSIGPFQFKKEIYEKIAAKYGGVIEPKFENAKLSDHIIAFYLLASDNLKIFERLFLSKSKKLTKMLEKADQKSKQRFIVVLISSMHNAGYDNILKVLGEGLGDVQKYKVSTYPDRKPHPNGYWDIDIKSINDKTLDLVVSKMIHHSRLQKAGSITAPYMEMLDALYEKYTEIFKGRNTFVGALLIKRNK
ncbi:MAG: hypothetical protein QXF35_03575 [Candidatus Bilamarchaeaceae archaeon]